MRVHVKRHTFLVKTEFQGKTLGGYNNQVHYNDIHPRVAHNESLPVSRLAFPVVEN